MKLLLDLLAIFGITIGSFIVLSFIAVFSYAVLSEPMVRGVLALVLAYMVSMTLFAWSYDRLVFPFLPWSKK